MAAPTALLRAFSRLHSIPTNLTSPTLFSLDLPLFVTPISFQRRLFSEPPEKAPDLSIETSTKQTESPPSIRIISYDVKPKEKVAAEAPPPPPPPPPISPKFSPPTKGDSVQVPEMKARPVSWSREDTRYIKNVPSISPVSYPMKSAPLPEDRDLVLDEEVVGAGSRSEYTMVEEQSRRRTIEATGRLLTRVSAAQVEEVPFPELIKVEKRAFRKVVYDLPEAIRKLKVFSQASKVRKFIETVEAHVKLAINMRRTDLTVRGVVSLPHGTGKVVKVAVFADGTAADEARTAGADIVGGVELVEEIKNSKEAPDVDWCISTEPFMDNLKKISMILRSLMPNPRKGSVTNDVVAAVKEVKKGFVEFKMDKTAIVHVGLGKVNMVEECLHENIGAFLNALLLAKPAGLKKIGWWELYGSGTPNLKKMSMRILSLTTSSSGCERTWSAFEGVHTKRRNRLESDRLQKLVYVKFNTRLLQSKLRGHDRDVLLPRDGDSTHAHDWLVEGAYDGGGDDVDPITGASWEVLSEAMGADETLQSRRSSRGVREIETDEFDSDSCSAEDTVADDELDFDSDEDRAHPLPDDAFATQDLDDC